MNKGSITVILKIPSLEIQKELEIQSNMPANELVKAVTKLYFNHVDEVEEKNYLKCLNPIVLLRGTKTVADYGLFDGSIIECDR